MPLDTCHVQTDLFWMLTWVDSSQITTAARPGGLLSPKGGSAGAAAGATATEEATTGAELGAQLTGEGQMKCCCDMGFASTKCTNSLKNHRHLLQFVFLPFFFIYLVVD